jgi:tetraacyldisaccharide 4'-kinase
MKIANIIKKLFLGPISILWESLYRIRRSFYEYGILKKSYFKVPILSVGNITFGGTGENSIYYMDDRILQ